MSNSVNANDVAITEFYKSWVFARLGDAEATKMLRAIRELNESARCGDPIPSAEQLKGALDAKTLIQLIADANGETYEELAYLEHNEGQ